MELNANQERLRAKGLGLAAISYDSPAVLKDFATRRNISFPLLSDENSSAIREWGILNESIAKTSPFYGVPHPVTFVVGADGKITSAYREDDYRNRYTTGAILAEPAPGTSKQTTAPTGRLRMEISSSDPVVRGGERVRLFVKIQLPPKMHVYAPGVQGYIPIDWAMKPGPAEVRPLEAPKPRTLHLKAIKETVPVFENEFLLTRDVVFTNGKELQQALGPDNTLTLEGRLRYQACDDTKCYVPEEVPLSWSFRYEPHDPTRVPEAIRRKQPGQ